jgi:hypothetical protein
MKGALIAMLRGNCKTCHLDLEAYPGVTLCPNCGTEIVNKEENLVYSDDAVGVFNSIQSFVKKLNQLILSPTDFFQQNRRSLISKSGVSTAISFALIVGWISSLVSFIWTSLLGTFFEGKFRSLLHISSEVVEPSLKIGQGMVDELRGKIYDYLFGAGSILLSPFLILIKLAVTAFIIHIAVRLFVEKKDDVDPKYSSTLKILCYSTAPSILNIIPGIGFVLSLFLSFIVSMVGLKETYKTTSIRAFFVLIFPNLIFIGILFLIIFLVFIFAINIYQMVL